MHAATKYCYNSFCEYCTELLIECKYTNEKRVLLMLNCFFYENKCMTSLRNAFPENWLVKR